MRQLPFSLAFLLARRELKHDYRFSLIFILNLSLGLLGFLTLDAFKVSVEEAIRSRSKMLLAADLSVSARRELTPDEARGLHEALGSTAVESRVTELYTMAAAKGSSRLVQIKAIESSYPFYGDMIRGGGAGAGSPRDSEAWASPELMLQLGIRPNDSVKLGDASFTVTDTVIQDPSSAASFLALAPKIYIRRDAIAGTGLARPGSSVTYTRLFRLPADSDSARLAQILNQRLSDPGIRIQTHTDASDQVGRVAKYLGDYLGLTTLVAFFLASVGAAYLFRSFLGRRLREIAILRSLGVGSLEARLCYAWQLCQMGAAAVIPAILGSLLLLPSITKLLQALFPFPVTPSLSARSILLALLLSTVGSLLLCLPVLARIGRLRPAVLFQESQAELPPSFRDSLWFIPTLIFYWGLAVWQAKSWIVGSLFVAILAGVTLAVVGLGAILLTVLGRIHLRSIQLRVPLRQLSRQKVATISCFLALSLGTLLINLITQIQVGLRAELETPERGKLPSFFLFDIQEDQIDGLVTLLRDQGATATNISPLVRARLAAVNGESFAKEPVSEGVSTREEDVERRFRNRGINLTYRDRLSDSEEIVAGHDFSTERGAEKVSVEREFARRLGLKIGDRMTFDVQGVTVEATVANFRRIRWTSFQPNFFLQFAPGLLDEAPKTFLASVPRLSLEDKTKLQANVVERFANISLVDVSQVVERVLAILEQMSWALQFMAYLAVAAGLVVLGSVARHQALLRGWDTALLKTLGAGFGQVRRMALFEFGMVGAVSAAFGVTGALGMSFVFSRLIFDNRWVFDWIIPTLSLVGVTLVAVIVADLATRRALRESPMRLLAARR